MRKLFEAITENIQSFIDQSDYLTLAIGCESSATIPVIKIVDGLEAEDTSNWYWVFKLDFVDPVQYTSAIIKDFSTKHEAVRLSMEKEGMKPWPPIPESILSEEIAPELRLRELMAYSRSLLPIPDSGSVVWVFFPLNVANTLAFAALMVEVMRHKMPFPWCHHIRVILRDDLSDEGFKHAVERSPRWRWYKPDLSPEAVERSLAEETADEKLPLNERMNALLVRAGMDYSHKRYAGALDKYYLLLKYHAGLGNPPMAAVALNGIGEVYQKLGDTEKASRYFEAALIPASSGEHPPIPIFLNVALNLANLFLAQRKWSEAEGYYDVTQKLAVLARSGQVRIRSLENKGYSQAMQGKYGEAIETWEQGLTLAEKLNEESLRRSLLNRLAQAYQKTGQDDKHREAEALLISSRKLGAHVV